jgi:hypothetical protein
MHFATSKDAGDSHAAIDKLFRLRSLFLICLFCQLDFALFAGGEVIDRAVVHDSPILSVVTLARIERHLTDLLVLPPSLQAFRF